MAAYENKMMPTGLPVEEFIVSIEHPVRRADARALDGMFRRITGQDAVMWGPTIVGYGEYHYEYDSGHSGDAFAAGFSPRKASLSLYGVTWQPEASDLLARLGKHRLGASCVYVNKLADVDPGVLEQLIRTGYRYAIEEIDQSRR